MNDHVVQGSSCCQYHVYTLVGVTSAFIVLEDKKIINQLTVDKNCQGPQVRGVRHVWGVSGTGSRYNSAAFLAVGLVVARGQ